MYVDIDHTMIGEDNSVRPAVEATLSHLTDAGHELCAWSGDTPRKDLLREQGLLRFFREVYVKPTSNYRERAKELRGNGGPDFVVDDHAQVVRMFGGIQLPCYYGEEHADQAFGGVGTAVDLHVQAGRHNHEDDLWIYTFDSDTELHAKRIRENRVSEVIVHRI